MTYALPGNTFSPTAYPFWFLELPQKIQEKFYEYVYGEKQSRRVFMVESTALNRGYYRPYNGTKLVVRGYDYEILAQVSKKVRADSHKARQRSFNGQMTIFWGKDWDSTPYKKICEPRWELLRGRITKLVIYNVSGRNVESDFPEVWKRIPTCFPRVAEIRVHCNAYRYIIDSGSRPWILPIPLAIIFDEAFKINLTWA
ncbi:hypothetical protein AYL99_06543 [Fonsecaea erecta]|uniref:Uncharacterized protein n=1 Tax=Fonsecaea erecta TaxID=1367422 RepID=A0A178ZJN4_9EURO|nr:hypothetical protein AYL99_06543 [Fonsecaea erecta]OAP59245.1 hypothetical protein AYL99_06543 [Fonsecaea erecta]